MALKRDPLELRLYSALKTAQQRVPDWPCSMPVPVLCTVGMQSAGKTTFIEALVGFRVGTTCTGTGTRCPVRYILKDGPPHFAVSGKTLKERCDIQVAVERYMEGLALKPKDGDRFSKEELKVEITDQDLPLLDITDLPGLKAKGEGAEEIKSIVRFYVEQQSARPVVLVKATESVETQADVELLKDVGIDPKSENVTVVVNYFNDQLYKFSKASELNEYCRGYVGEYSCVFFCMLIYSQAAKDAKDKLDFEGEGQYYHELPMKEKETFEQKILSMSRDVDFDEEAVMARFGVVPAIQKMQSTIRDFIVNEGRKYSIKLAPMEEEMDDRLRAVQQELKKCNPEHIKEQRERYVERWGDVVRDLQRCRKRPGDDTEYNPIECGTDFFQELMEAREKADGQTLLGKCRTDVGVDAALEGWGAAIAEMQNQESAAEVQNQAVNRIPMKLTADASLARLLHAFDMVVTTQVKMQNVSEEEALAISGFAPGDMLGAFDDVQVIKEVAARPLSRVREKIWLTLLHIEVIFSHALKPAHDALKGHPGHTKALEAATTECYLDCLRNKMRDSQERSNAVMTEMTRYILVDNRLDNIVAPASGVYIDLIAAFAAFLVASSGAPALLRLAAFLVAPRRRNGALLVLLVLLGRHSVWLLLRRFLAARLRGQMLLRLLRARNRIEEVNCKANMLFLGVRRDFLRHFDRVIAASLYDYLKRDILLHVRDHMRQQIRDTDAKRIDEDTRARVTELRKQEKTLKDSLDQTRLVLELIGQLDDSLARTTDEADVVIV